MIDKPKIPDAARLRELSDFIRRAPVIFAIGSYPSDDFDEVAAILRHLADAATPVHNLHPGEKS
jgi:hypothetical protein